jgi:hypothetical protein
MTTPSLTELAAQISSSAATIEKYLKTNNVPAPSFDENGPPSLPHAPEVAEAKMQLLQSLSDLTNLTRGPAEMLTFFPVFVS